MNKHLGEIITKGEAAQIVLHAIGREATERELKESEIESYDFVKEDIPDHIDIDSLELKLKAQQLTIPLYMDTDSSSEFPAMKIVISANGLVEYKNWADCPFPLLNPIEVYKIILAKEEEFKILWQST